MTEEPQHVEAIVVSNNALEQIERASIDIQIATAKRYPRSMEQFYKRAESMVTMDEATAASCIYRRPVGKEGGKMKFAEGESVRLAEIVASSFGNIRVAGRITEMDPRFVKAQGVAHDLETNTAYTAEVVESTVTRNGTPFSERMRVVVAKSAQSKAIRDAIFRVIPKSLCKTLVTKAKLVAQGDVKTLTSRREGVLKWIETLGIDVKRVWNAIGIHGPDDIDMNVLLLLAGLKTALDEGDCTVDETFPKSEAEQKKGTTTERIKDKFQKDEAPPKRKRRTKAEIEADKKAEDEKSTGSKNAKDEAEAKGTEAPEPDPTEPPVEDPEPTQEEQEQEPPDEALGEDKEPDKYECKRCKRTSPVMHDEKCPFCMGEMKEI